MTGPRPIKILLNLCMCTSLLRCTPDLALADGAGPLALAAMAAAPDRLRQWIAPSIEYQRPIVRPLQALRTIADAMVLAL